MAEKHDRNRERLMALDRQLLQTLNERFGLARQLDHEHRNEGLPPGPAELKMFGRQVCEGVDTAAVPAEVLQAILREVWSGDLAIHQSGTVAFLGPMATFTHQAALVAFGAGMQTVEQPTIGDVFDAVSRGDAAYGVVPVENSTEGCVTHTLDMFADTDLKICAELNLAIHHCLLSPLETTEIEVLYSHSQVFGQCRRWLQRNMPAARLIEVSSTTEATARCLREPRSGALASALAAERYGVPIRASKIEDSTDNTTRFLILGRQSPAPTGDDKTSLLMAIRHRVGALYDSLLPFGKHGVNLTFIESRPSKRRNWEYYFFIDFVGHVTEERVQAMLEELGEHCQFIKILGSYPRAGDSR